MTPLLEVHHVDVKGGDGTVILVKDRDAADAVVFSVLIDAGVSRGGLRLKQYVAGLNLPGALDVLIASHYHDDHMAGIVPCGFAFKQLVDLGGYTSTAEPLGFQPVNGDGLGNTTPNYIGAYRKYVAARLGAGGTRLPIPFLDRATWKATESGEVKPDAAKMTPLVIPLGTPDITLSCYCAGGVVPRGTDAAAQNVAKGQKDVKGRPLDPNDLSLAWLLKWGDFTYLTSGDLSGDPDMSSYYFLEKALLDALTATGGPLAGKALTVLKAPHHGSERSTYHISDTDGFLPRLKPDTIIVSCNTSKQVPHPVFLKRVADYCAGRTTKPHVLFVSDMCYAGSSDHAKLVAGFVTGGVTPEENVVVGSDGTVQNLATSAVVVKRYAPGSTPPDEAGKTGDSVGYFDGYRVLVLKGRVVKDSKEVVARGASYVWRAAIPASFGRVISMGFKAMAADMFGWLTEDGTRNQTQGIDYIRANYPGVVALIENGGADSADKIAAEFQTYFDTQYTLVTPTAPSYSVRSETDRSLTMDEREALFNALNRNRYQDMLNGKLDSKFRVDRAWNLFSNDPYYVAPTVNPPEGPTTKKQKTIDIRPITSMET